MGCITQRPGHINRMRSEIYDMSAQEKESLRLIVSNNVDAIVAVDRDGIVQFVNPAAERLFERSAEQMIGQMFGFPIESDKPQEMEIIHPGKDLKIAEMRVAETVLDGETLYVASLRDITELARLREELRTLALIDDLTGLYNRRGFLALAQQHLKLAKRTKRPILLLYADIDGLKYINDTQGHLKGDLVLKEIARVLKKTFRESDIIARIGGDEFAVLAIEAPAISEKAINTRLQKNIKTFNARVNPCLKHKMSLSMGAAYYDPEHPCSVEELIARADAAMYRQKHGKR